MRKFNLNKALKGSPLCTREGLPARIICYDRKSVFNNGLKIVALIDKGDWEDLYLCNHNGEGNNNKDDLFMAPIKHEAYVDIIEYGQLNGQSKRIITGPYKSEEEAKNAIIMPEDKLIAVSKVTWEE